MHKPSVWYVNVFVSDLERAIDFYEKKLGLELRHAAREHGYAAFTAGPVGLGLAQVEQGAPEAGLVGRHTGVGLGVPDLASAYEQLRGRGVRFTQPPEKQPWGGFMAMLADPDGNVFYLDQLREE
jgi:predicted enzyme related to lactoylglutathione lyase